MVAEQFRVAAFGRTASAGICLVLFAVKLKSSARSGWRGTCFAAGGACNVGSILATRAGRYSNGNVL